MTLQKSFEEKLEIDSENWLIWDDNWINYWNKKDNYGLINIDDKGFILYKHINKTECYIVFAFVYSKERKKGYLRQMLKELENKYNIIKLASFDDITDKVWSKLGFHCYKKGGVNECNYFTNIHA